MCISYFSCCKRSVFLDCYSPISAGCVSSSFFSAICWVFDVELSSHPQEHKIRISLIEWLSCLRKIYFWNKIWTESDTNSLRKTVLNHIWWRERGFKSDGYGVQCSSYWRNEKWFKHSNPKYTQWAILICFTNFEEVFPVLLSEEVHLAWCIKCV